MRQYVVCLTGVAAGNSRWAAARTTYSVWPLPRSSSLISTVRGPLHRESTVFSRNNYKKTHESSYEESFQSKHARESLFTRFRRKRLLCESSWPGGIINCTIMVKCVGLQRSVVYKRHNGDNCPLPYKDYFSYPCCS